MKDFLRILPVSDGFIEDYATIPVPEERRVGGLTQGLIWSGGVFCAPIFAVGGTLAAAMPPARFLAAVLIGSALITLTSFLNGYIGTKTHLSSVYNARFALGTNGGKLFSLFLALAMFGWFGYQSYYFASSTLSTLQMFGLSGGSTVVWTVIGGILMMVTAVFGLNGIILLAALGVPILMTLTLIAFGLTADRLDPAALASAVPADGGMGLANGIALVVASYITGACVNSDLSRFSKKPSDAAVSCLLSCTFMMSAVLLLGGFFYYACGTFDPCNVFVMHCGMGMFVPFFLVVSIWTTNHFNLYCAVLGISNLMDEQIKLPRWLLTLLMGTVATLLSAMGIMETLSSFLDLLSVLIPPVIAVIITDYYFYNRNSGLYDYASAGRLPKYRRNTCLAALTGIAVGLLCNYANIGFLDALCAVIPACFTAMLASLAALVVANTVAPGK